MTATKFYNLDLDDTLGGNNASDYVVSSQKSIKTYIDNRIDGTSYTATNPVLTPVSGICTWTVTHNLGTQDVICTLYSGAVQVATNVTIVSNNVVTVAFMASETVTAGSCKVVVLASGGAQGSGGGGSITVDSALSTTSENPVQNKVITNYVQPSLNNFLPNGTEITVETDGSGDFTTLAEAINYLSGKWSNGTVTIKLGSGTFSVGNGLEIQTRNMNLGLKIAGDGINNTILNNNSNGSWGIVVFGYPTNCGIVFTNFTIQGQGANYYGIACEQSTNVKIDTVAFKNFDVSLISNALSRVTVNSSQFINITSRALQCWDGDMQIYGNMVFNNVGTCFHVNRGGIIRGRSFTPTYTSITNKTNQEVGTATSSGWITGAGY